MAFFDIEMWMQDPNSPMKRQQRRMSHYHVVCTILQSSILELELVVRRRESRQSSGYQTNYYFSFKTPIKGL